MTIAVIRLNALVAKKNTWYLRVISLQLVRGRLIGPMYFKSGCIYVSLFWDHTILSIFIPQYRTPQHRPPQHRPPQHRPPQHRQLQHRQLQDRQLQLIHRHPPHLHRLRHQPQQLQIQVSEKLLYRSNTIHIEFYIFLEKVSNDYTLFFQIPLIMNTIMTPGDSY